jgi:hypothetical protein
MESVDTRAAHKQQAVSRVCGDFLSQYSNPWFQPSCRPCIMFLQVMPYTTTTASLALVDCMAMTQLSI